MLKLISVNAHLNHRERECSVQMQCVCVGSRRLDRHVGKFQGKQTLPAERAHLLFPTVHLPSGAGLNVTALHHITVT